MDDVLLCEVVLALIFLTGTAANATVLLVLYRRPALRTLSNRFVVNLLCTNLVSTSVLLPLALLNAIEHPVGEGVTAGMCAASVLAVFLISLDQYCAVVDPLRYHARISKARSVGLMLAAWSVACLLGVLRGAGEWSEHFDYRSTFAAVFIAVVFLVPFFAILWMYVCIYSAAHKNSKRTRRTGSGPIASATGSHKCRVSNASMFLYREETRAARVSALVIVMALVCWLPYVTVLGLRTLTHVPRYVHYASVTLLVSAALVSPCLFPYRNRRIQREARRLLGIPRRDKDGRSRQQKPQVSSEEGTNRQIGFLASCVREPAKGELVVIPDSALAVDTCRSSFSSGGSSSTQGTSSIMDTD
ncbi:5-hydroxytryptamine receptor 6 [Zootermopsis nevadensis]|uniref:5-hydroxytryptamine receptor 6 n=2 Tax=Zootermopsis nevadensis TaxID=136037 RepID=A0A067QM48_ZOONE|nr:5-hydroxytryptamine receptor 6 [Zootermopsis nevadensis]